jgi:hypothetical protein
VCSTTNLITDHQHRLRRWRMSETNQLSQTWASNFALTLMSRSSICSPSRRSALNSFPHSLHCEEITGCCMSRLSK